jgi:uncharacterized protein (DUF885 family)
MRLSLLLLTVLVSAGCGAREPGAAREVNALADQFVARWIETWPDQATIAGVAGAPLHRLPDLSPEAIAEWERYEEETLAALDAVDVSALPAGHSARITHGFLTTALRNAIGFRACRTERWNVSPTWTGWPSRMAGLADAHPFATQADIEAFGPRFSALPRYLQWEIFHLRRGLAEGYTAPRTNVEAVIRQVEGLLASPPEASPWAAAVPDSLPGLLDQILWIDTSAIRPSIREYLGFLRHEYLPAARTAVGVSANPEGDACYRAAIRYHATVEMSPEDVHQVGLEQMAVIRAEMEAVSERLFGHADVARAIERLRNDPQFQMGSREAMLALARDAVARGQAAAPQWFGLLPRAGVIVEPVPAFAEASAPGAFYTPPAEDGSRPGRYSINLRGAETTPRAGIEATAFHEAFPGHHLQIAIAQERAGLHPVQRYLYLSGFGEGWALYTERLADEMALYSTDADRFGLLSNEALRAARLVVDAGMHALGWTRQQAIDYMLATTTESRASVEAEVDRYIAVPGQATAYMLGSLEIMRLRAEAQAALGEQFDIRTFHDRVLEDGAVPLSMLREKIERWIAGGG